MRVLLIYSNRTRILEPVPPIGLSYGASATRNAGHEVHFLDLMISRHPETALRRALEEFRPEVVGVSVRNIDNVVPQRLSYQLGEIDSMLASIRKQSSAKIVLGGPAISILKGSALERFDADFAIRGEGEISFPNLLAALESGTSYHDISGLCYRTESGIHYNEVARHRRTFEFTDSTFNIPSSHAVEICKEIIRRNLKLKLSAVGINPLGMTEELVRLMKQAGFISCAR
jgi:radical SAM superfamily enzyme YgiQ (UPF0313 family)